MAKYTKKFSITKASLDLGNMEMTEVVKEDVLITDLMEVLKQFDGNVISLSISVDTEAGKAE